MEKNRNREKERDREKDKEKDAETYSADRDLGSMFSVPLGRVYETRGTLLLETQGTVQDLYCCNYCVGIVITITVQSNFM